MNQPTAPNPHLEQARSAAARGDLQAAATLYQRAIAGEPGCAEAHAGLAMLLAQTGRPQPALASLRTATRLDPDNAGYHHTLGLLLASLNQLDAALEAHNRARALDPTLAPAHVDAAMLLEMRGERDAARRAVEAALGASPDDARARIVAIRLAFRAGESEPSALERYRAELRTLADAAPNPVVSALALDILIDVCERLGDYESAWSAIGRCNDADRSITGPALATPAQREARLREIDSLAAALDPVSTARWSDECPDDGLPSPALLVAFPRSGTTMTERALDAHPGIVSLEEQPTFRLAAQHIPRVVPEALLRANPGPELLDALTPEHVGALRKAYWEHANRLLGRDPSRDPARDALVLDKLPFRISELGFVNRLFPDARIIVALRDPRDVCLSCVRQRFGYAGNILISFFLDPGETARLYRHVMSAWLAAREAITNPFLEARYEDTVSDFEGRMRAMLEFLGVGFDPAVLAFHTRTDRLHNTPSYHAVQRKVTTAAVARWKKYEAQLGPILPTLRPFVGAFGYD